jgi:general secretion pathway protein L
MATNMQESNTGVTFIDLVPGGPVPGSGQIALVPGVDIPVIALDLPPGLSGSAREQIARRQLADQVGLNPERVEMRPFHLRDRAGNWTRAMVADATLVSQWRETAGAACRAVLPDYLALPTAAGLWTVLEKEGLVLARLSLQDGFSSEPDLARIMLAQALNDDSREPPKAILLQGKVGKELRTLLDGAGVPLIDRPEAAIDLGLEPAKVLGHGEIDLDLRRDPQAAKLRLRRQVLPWRWPILIGLVAAGVWAAAQIIATRTLTGDIAQLERETTELVRTYFVPSGPILDVRAQITREVETRRSEAADWQGRERPLALLGQAAVVLAEHQAIPGHISYAPPDGLSTTVQVEDFAAVDQLVEALRGVGLLVTVLQSRVSDGSPEVLVDLNLNHSQGEGQ